MSKFRLSILVTLMLMATIPFGVAPTQAATVEGTGTAVIWNDQALSDAITYSMSGVTLPAADKSYEGWLVSDNGKVKLSTGVMTVNSDGTIAHTFTSPDGEDLILNYDKVLITEEPVPDDDPGPSGAFVFSHQIPAGGIAYIRHLLSSWPGGAEKGILTNLKEQLDVGIVHGTLAKNSTTLADVHKHAHHVINILEGENGANFDASFGNPGDGFGALNHAADRKHAGFAAGSAADDAVILAGSTLVDTTGKNAADWATAARDQALTVLATTNVALAKIFLGPGGNTVISSLEAARNGFDADTDGTIESIAGEGGAEQAYVEAQKMATYTLTPGPLPAPAAPAVSLGLPSVGDSSVSTLAQIALITSLVLLATGGLIIIRGRRSRTRA